MAFWNFWKRKTNGNEQLRRIKTIRGQRNIDSAIKKGNYLIHRKVEPFSAVIGKYCIVKNKKTGKEFKITDFRDDMGKTLTINPLRRSNLTPLHRNYSQLKIPNVTSV